jgi:hypothetical protein
MSSMLKKRDWSQLQRRALTPTGIVEGISETDFECAARADALLA